MEQEPGLHNKDEDPEKIPEQHPNSDHKTETPEPISKPADARKVIEEKPAETENPKITFENLSNFLGRKIRFRDSSANMNNPEDQLYKIGELKRDEKGFFIEINRGQYYPLFTGLERRSTFTIGSQSDVDHLQIELKN